MPVSTSWEPRGLRPAAAVIADAFEALRPPKEVTVLDFAEHERMIPPESGSRPGPYDVDLVPFMREPMLAISDDAVEEVVFMGPAQCSKTEALFINPILHSMRYDPGPTLWIVPTDAKAKGYSKKRITPSIRDTPSLKGLIDLSTRNSSNTIQEKLFPGGSLNLSGANSPTNLAGDPIRYFYADDIDRFPYSSGDEGNPVDLGWKRTTTFTANRKGVFASTPTVKGLSKIEAKYKETDMHEWETPCPHCGEFQVITFKRHVRWEERPEDAPDTWKPSRAWLECEHCSAVIEDHQRHAMNAAGIWRPRAAFYGKRGYWLRGVMTPFVGLLEFAHKFLDVRDYPDRLQTFINTDLGELWDDEGNALDAGELAARRIDYHGEVPVEAVLLTSGWDVQDDRIEGEVLAFDENERQLGVQYFRFNGDPSKLDGPPGDPSPWQQLEALLESTFRRPDGATLRIAGTCIDTGHLRDTVEAFVQRSPKSSRVFAIKGASQRHAPMAVRGKKPGPGRPKLYTVGVHNAKNFLAHRMRIEDLTAPGAMVWPHGCGYDADYFKQFTAEKRIREWKGGQPVEKWVCPKNARNEAWDCRVYAVIAFHLMHARRYLPVLAQRLRESTGAAATPPAPAREVRETPGAPAQAAPAPARRQRKVKSKFVG